MPPPTRGESHTECALSPNFALQVAEIRALEMKALLLSSNMYLKNIGNFCIIDPPSPLRKERLLMEKGELHLFVVRDNVIQFELKKIIKGRFL